MANHHHARPGIVLAKQNRPGPVPRPSRERYKPIQLIRPKFAKEIQISKQPAFIFLTRHVAAPF
jgi:hypothetical protein